MMTPPRAISRTGSVNISSEPLHRLDHESPENRHKQIRPRAGSGHPQHVALWIAQPAKVDRNGFAHPECVLPLAWQSVSKPESRSCPSDDVTDRIERNATRLIGRQIAEMSGRVTVRRFMQGNRENPGIAYSAMSGSCAPVPSCGHSKWHGATLA